MNIKQETHYSELRVRVRVRVDQTHFSQTSQTVTFVKGGLERYLMAKFEIKILFKITFVAKVVF